MVGVLDCNCIFTDQESGVVENIDFLVQNWKNTSANLACTSKIVSLEFNLPAQSSTTLAAFFMLS